MNREIEFRGKDIETGEWIYGYYAKTPTTDQPLCVRDCRAHSLIIKDGLMFYVDSETIGQWTGLKDKDGNKIYEGDIIEICFPYVDKTPPHRKYSLKIKDIVAYGKLGEVDCFVLGGRSLNIEINDSNTKSEVIGNIHDNMGLLSK